MRKFLFNLSSALKLLLFKELLKYTLIFCLTCIALRRFTAEQFIRPKKSVKQKYRSYELKNKKEVKIKIKYD